MPDGGRPVWWFRSPLAKTIAAGLSIRVWVVLAVLLWPSLLPLPCVNGQSAQVTSPASAGDYFFGKVHDGKAAEYRSPHVQGVVRVCKDVAWPEGTDREFLPLLSANRAKLAGKTVLDIGTGCGILALYAAQSGAARVVATDIDPVAIACTRENARRLGLASVIETRLVDAQDPAAFSAIRSSEIFDLIVTAPPQQVNRAPFADNGTVEDGITPNDYIRLGFSIIRGLGAHLHPQGAAIIAYRSAVMQTLMVSFARELGFIVEYHPAEVLRSSDWCALYNTFVIDVARTERLNAAPLLLPPRQDVDPHVAFRKVIDVDFLVPSQPDSGGEKRASQAVPLLWDTDMGRIVPGLMVIRKPPGSPRQTTGAQRGTQSK